MRWQKGNTVGTVMKPRRFPLGCLAGLDSHNILFAAVVGRCHYDLKERVERGVIDPLVELQHPRNILVLDIEKGS